MRQAKLIKKQQLDFLSETLDCQLIQNGITSVVLIDLAGNILTDLSNREHDFDTYALASLSAGNFGAVTALLSHLGEPELKAAEENKAVFKGAKYLLLKNRKYSS